MIVESQIHGQLTPMMGQMVERVAKNDMPRRFHHDLPTGKKAPLRRQEELIVGLRQRLARLLHVLIERFAELVGGGLLVLTALPPAG